MNNNKQSSVEWYDNEIGKLFNEFTVDKITIYKFRTEQLKLKQQAKAMHKEEVIDAHGDQYDYSYSQIDPRKVTGEQYYEQTFGGNK